MKTFKNIILLFSGILLFSAPSFVQGIVIKQSNESGIYDTGENITVSVQLQDITADFLAVKIVKNNIQTIVDKRVEKPGKEVVIFNDGINDPASLIFEVKTGNEFVALGAIVAPDKLSPGFKRPPDLDKYWAMGKRALRALPMEIKDIPVNDIDKGYICSNLEINCTGAKPVRGYLARPEKARPGSLPIVLFVHAAGVSGDWCLAKPEIAAGYAKMGKGALSFDLNAHGMMNSMPAQYYIDLENGELKNYWHSGVESRDDFYFRGMYLRMIRCLDFLTSKPEWDGKRILVIGESQGGGQALAAAGLDNRVSAVVATVPAMCDWGGKLSGRAGGWPDPFGSNGNREKMLKTLPYFDVASLLTGSNATIFTEIGLIDYTCPASSIYAALNQAKGKKITIGVPYRGHHLDQVSYQKIWEETVSGPKMDFILDILK